MFRSRRWLGSIATLAAGGLLVAWILSPDDHAGPCVVVDGPVQFPDIPETSGLAVSRRTPGVIWSHNDSGNAPVLFAIDTAGTVRGRMSVSARMRDWEDISLAPCPTGDCLYLADIGDNRSVRPQVSIYRLPEPLPSDTTVAAIEVFRVTYADGPHNAEASFVIGEDLFIVTRDRTGGVYRSRVDGSGNQQLTFERVGELGLLAVSDAETSRDGRFVAVRTGDDVVLYASADVIRGVFVPALHFPVERLREAQGEGVAVDGPRLYLSSEGRPWSRAGTLITLECEWPAGTTRRSGAPAYPRTPFR